jgi:hypothetical protein
MLGALFLFDFKLLTGMSNSLKEIINFNELSKSDF